MSSDGTEITQLRAAAARQAVLVTAAYSLQDATTPEQVLALVTDTAARAVGASGAGLALVTEDRTGVRVLTTGYFAADVRTRITRLPAEAPLPIVRAAVDGTAFFFSDRAEAEARFPGLEQLYAAARTEGSAEVPLLSEGTSFGTLSLAFAHPHAWNEDEQDLLGALAALTAQAVSRIRAREAERATAARTEQVLESMAVGYLAMDAQWRFTYVNAEGRRIVAPAGTELVGEQMWDLFPATVGTEFEAGYRRAVETGQVVTFDAYYPAPFDAWYEIRAVPQGDGGLSLYFIDITARRRAEIAREAAARRVAALGAIALGMTEADTVEDLVQVVAEQGFAALGADGGSIALPDPDESEVMVSYITTSYGEQTRSGYTRLRKDLPLPLCVAASTGQRALYPDRAACLALSAEHMPGAMAATGSQAFASIPMFAGGRLVGVLTAGWSVPQAFDAEQLELLETLAAQCAQALDRLAAREAERAASAQVARFSETLQRSLLTAPPQPDHLQIEVRYTPATAQAQVGGDWYDAFITDDGTTSLVIGDVTGHDQRAAAVMAQMRNLLRGIGYTVGDPPALVLRALDRAVHALGVDGMATAVLAQVEQDQAHRAAGTRVLHWSNAGHPAPLLLEPGRTPRFLETPPDLLLGLDPDAARDDHHVVLEPGATVLMFTDGLVERRGTSLEEGMAWLAGAAAALADLPLQDLCDELLAQVAGQVEDDVALLALRAHPEDGPRPVEAGPEFDPREQDAVGSEQPR